MTGASDPTAAGAVGQLPDEAAAPSGGAPPASRAATPWWAVPAACVLAGVALFALYYRMSITIGANSDGAANALQAWDMLHGNLLLHGWVLSDVSFYTTELPEYMLIELVHGLNPNVVHLAGALTYTLLVLTAALLARGRARGGPGWARMAVTAGIMMSPQLWIGTNVLLATPDHTGTTVPVLVTWLVLDRGGRRSWVPVAVGALLAWTLVADPVTLYIAIVPLLVVSLLRAYQEIARRRQPVTAAWYELSLAAAAVAAAAIGLAAPALIHHFGGYLVWPSPHTLAPVHELSSHLGLTSEGLLLLYGADFIHLTRSVGAGLVGLHLVGLALAAWALGTVLWRFFRHRDIVAQLLAAGTVLIVVGYLLGTTAANGSTSHEMAAALPFGAVLAGRVLTDRLRRLALPGAVVGLGYLLTLVANALPAAIVPAALIAGPTTSAQQIAWILPPTNQGSADWLAAHHLRYGLSGYWQAASTTLASGNQVHIVPVRLGYTVVRDGITKVKPHNSYELQPSWYNPRLHDARFYVFYGVGRGPLPTEIPWLERVFGPPAATYHYRSYTYLVWNYNLLTRVVPP